MLLWWCLSIATCAAAIVQLLLLHHRRRLLVADPMRRSFFVRHIRNPRARLSPTPAVIPPPPERIEPRIPTAAAPTTPVVAAPGLPSDEGILYIDATGHCTFANRAARKLLRWRTGELVLRDVLAGGIRESAALLEELAQRGAVESHATALAGASPEPLELSGVALKDRDDNLWGAALSIHPPGAASPTADASRSAPSRH
jgi:PAS domain-containing protein